MSHAAEPWLRGPIEGVHPVAAHLLYTFEQTREEVERFIAVLPEDAVWRAIPGIAPLGFHLRHTAGSIDRLSTYLAGGQLSDEQIAFLKREGEPGEDFASLAAGLYAQLDRTAAQVRAIPVGDYELPRAVGRKLLPTTVAGLIIHLSEHTQRHLGQAVLTAKLLVNRTRSARSDRQDAG
jgi:DinB superfamily